MSRKCRYFDKIDQVRKLSFYLGHGMVGGNLISGFFQGEAAAMLANRILAGESPDSIAVVKYGAKRNMFDYKQLQRWGISQSKLPPDSIIINKPSSFYEEYQRLVWGVTVFGSVLGLTIVVLTMNIRRRNRAEQQLRQAQEALEQKVQERTAQLNSAKVLAEETASRLERSMAEIEALVNNSPVGIIFMDEGRIIKRVNPEIVHITGYEPDELVGKTTVPFFLSRDDYEAFGKMVYPVLRPALEMTAQQHSGQDLPPAAGLPCFSGIVLLADDDAMVSDAGRQMLEKIGFDVLVAGDGQEAVDIYRRNQEIIDLVILDVSMPAKDGVAALQELQRLNAQVKVILASGYAEEQVMIGEGEVHPAAFIHKPFMLEELAETIGGILAGEG